LPDDPDVEVWAGGGVIVDAEDRVLVVHRSRYDDWSFPKGKLDEGEQLDTCALREVEEETGLRCRLGALLPDARYRDDQGRIKAVRYWVMAPVGGSFLPNAEVDQVVWLTREEAARRLSYHHDVALLEHLGGT
jgi:8-oxo-dGTP diphosphatase